MTPLRPARLVGSARHLLRTGLAAIEFVMALTVILLLLVALLWIGQVAANTVGAAVEARHDAWTRRPRARPRSFDFTDLEGGRVQGTATVPVRVSPLFDGLILPRAEQIITAGSWDHRVERFERSPNRRLYPVLLRTALASEAADMADVDGLLASFADRITAAADQDREAESFRRDEERQRRELDRIRRERAAELDRANQRQRAEIEGMIRAADGLRSEQRRRASALDREIGELDRAIVGHAALEPQDDAHRKEAERLEKHRQDRRRERRETEEKIRQLDEFAAEARRAAGL
jgi:hypothetical protein